MDAVRAIFVKDLRLRLRDRTVFIYGVVAPFVLAFVLGLVFADVDQPLSLRITVAAPADASLSGPLVEDVLPALEADGLVGEVVVVDDRDEVVDDVESGEADVGMVVLPDGPAGPTGVEVVEEVDRPIAASVARGVAQGLVDEARTAVLAVGAALAADPSIDPATVVAAVVDAPDVATVELVETGAPPLDGRTRVAAGIAVLFLLFAVGLVTTSLLEEERDGTLARLRTAPIPGWSVLAAKALLGFAVGVVSLTTLAVGTTLALGADWGDPVVLGAMILLGSAAAVGVVSLVASVGRTPEAASSGVAIVATVAGALGGSFFPVQGPLLTAVAALTPHYWFLRGIEGGAGGGGLGDVVVEMAVLVAITVVTGVLAVTRLRRRLAVA